MSKQTINLGTPPTGVGGDTPRSAFTKAQSNFDELYTALGAAGSPGALPTALPITRGGTGNTTGTASKLAAAMIAGIVSDAGGVPNGAILESNSNANGSYIKMADGTLICLRTNDYTDIPVAVATGVLFRSNALVRTSWAHPFVAEPRCAHSSMSSSGVGISARGSAPTALETPIMYAIEYASATRTVTIDHIGCGRWK